MDPRHDVGPDAVADQPIKTPVGPPVSGEDFMAVGLTLAGTGLESPPRFPVPVVGDRLNDTHVAGVDKNTPLADRRVGVAHRLAFENDDLGDQ